MMRSTILAQRKSFPFLSPIIRRAVWLCVVLLSAALVLSSSSTLAQISSGKSNQAALHSSGLLDGESQAQRQAGNPGVIFNTAIRQSREEQLDIPTLLRESDFNGATFHERLLDFTYTLKRTRRKLDMHNKVKEEGFYVFEAYPVMGMHVLVMLSKNGLPVPADKVLEARKSAGENLSRAELAATGQLMAVTSAKAGSVLKRHLSIGMMVGSAGKAVSIFWDPSDFLRSCEFSAPRRELLNNREVIVLDFRPPSGLNSPKTKPFINRLVGRVWIDRLDKVVVSIKGWIPSGAAVEQGKKDPAESAAAVIYEQVRLPTGEWFPRYVRMNSGGDQTLFNGLNWDVVFEFSEYKRFKTNVEDVKINSPEKKIP